MKESKATIATRYELKLKRYWVNYVMSHMRAQYLDTYLVGYGLGSPLERKPYWIKKRINLSLVTVLVHANDSCHHSIVENFYENN